ncbi:hypothetical protein BGW39_004225, partial [Mortierella sp. 14UC]
ESEPAEEEATSSVFSPNFQPDNSLPKGQWVVRGLEPLGDSSASSAAPKPARPITLE